MKKIAVCTLMQHFTAFGEGKADIRWGYQSKVHDFTGLIYFGRRYYDPNSGRFITSDPEGYIDGPNLYAYTLNNPLTHHDPYGLYIYLNKDHFKEMGIGLYHGSLSYARDTTLSAGKYLGGIHGLDDMSFSDIYSAHLDADDRFTKKTDNWMASSPYASGDLYQFTRGATYEGMDFASGFLFPFGQMKTAASAGKAILKAEKIARSSPTLLKTRAMTSRIFSSHKKVQNASRGAENINASINLTKKLSQLQKAQTQGQKLRILQDGRHRYYSEFIPASKPGITQGARRVTEYNPSKGSVRTWHECYNSRGKVVRVHPKQINGQELQSPHYPKIGPEIK